MFTCRYRELRIKIVFFVKYTPENTLRERWYIVQVDLDATIELNANTTNIYSYHCNLLTRHPNNRNKRDEFKWFWPEWHRYSRCYNINTVVYRDCILIRPSHTPDMNRYSRWSDNLSLLKRSISSQSILCPFHFTQIDAYNRTRQKKENK